MYHAEQDRTNMYGEVVTREVLLLREIDAQKYLLLCTEKYKIPLREVEITERNLKDYEDRLKSIERKMENEKQVQDSGPVFTNG